MKIKLINSYLIKGKIECLSGLHIGGNNETIEIGDIDNPVIKNPVTGYPYIPGSSLKGSLRCAIEYKLGKGTTDKKGIGPCSCGKDDCYICRVFGNISKHSTLGPTRIIVRDANISEETINRKNAMKNPEDFLEVKTEISIDRASQKTKIGSLRTQERVPEGSKFDFRIVIRQFDIDGKKDDKDKMINFVKEAMRLLQTNSYIGGSGSRGYGEIKFIDLTLDGEKFEL